MLRDSGVCIRCGESTLGMPHTHNRNAEASRAECKAFRKILQYCAPITRIHLYKVHACQRVSRVLCTLPRPQKRCAREQYTVATVYVVTLHIV